jgi:hypothetical protein
MTNSHSQSRPPTEKQLRYLRDLAARKGQTFATPRTSAEASSEIERLKGAGNSAPGERRRELRDLRRDITDRWRAATRVRREEIEGYGSSAHWK